MLATLAAVALGAVGISIVQAMTAGARIAAKAEHTQVLYKVTVLVAAVWCTIITGIRVQVAVGAVGRIGHITARMIPVLGRPDMTAGNIRVEHKDTVLVAAVWYITIIVT